MAKNKKERWSLIGFLTGSSRAENLEAKAKVVEAKQTGKTERAEAKYEYKAVKTEEKTIRKANAAKAFLDLHSDVQDNVSAVGSGILGLFGIDAQTEGERDAAAAAAAAPITPPAATTTPTTETNYLPWIIVGGAIILLSGRKNG